MVSIYKKKSPLFTSILLSLIFLSVSLPIRADEKISKSVTAKRKLIDKIQIASFRLIDGQAVNGKVISENRYEIEISEIGPDGLTPKKYEKEIIQKGSIAYKNLTAPDYWIQTGDYFLEKVWDFENDPDEFARALRCFEKAKSLVEESFGPEHKLATDLTQKTDRIRKDMQKWTEQIKIRQQMRELELLSTLDEKLERISARLDENARNIERVNRRLLSAESTMKDLSQLKNELSSSKTSTEMLVRQILKLENDMYNLRRRYGYRPRYYIEGSR